MKAELEELAKGHNVTITKTQTSEGFHIVYNRGVDRFLIDKIEALPMEIRQRYGWCGDEYVDTLTTFIHPIEVSISLLEGKYSLRLTTRFPLPPLVGDEYFGASLGRRLDSLFCSDLIISNGQLRMRLSYQGQESEFAKELYQALEAVYLFSSVPAEVERRIDRVSSH